MLDRIGFFLFSAFVIVFLEAGPFLLVAYLLLSTYDPFH